MTDYFLKVEVTTTAPHPLHSHLHRLYCRFMHLVVVSVVRDVSPAGNRLDNACWMKAV